MKPMLSGVIIAKNESQHIGLRIGELGFCDEIIVVDDFSTDKTAAIAKKAGAKVYKRRLTGDFAAQRNFALKKTRGEWVLFVDADEIVRKRLAHEIVREVKKSGADGFMVERKAVFMGKALLGGEWGSTWLLRLARKNSGTWKRAVHEEWKVKGEVARLKNPLLHSPPPGIKKLVAKLSAYARIHAQENNKTGKKGDLAKIVFYPLAKFVNNFLFRGGYKDGSHGFVLAVLMSFHSFLAWVELWQIQQKQR